MINLRTEPVDDLREHASIQNVYESTMVFDVRQSQAGFELAERTLAAPYRKNYDEFEKPLAWPRDFDTSRWVLISSFFGAHRVGGVIVARGAPTVRMLEGRADLGILWDLRVAPACRRHGVGTALIHAAEQWAQSQGCVEIEVETQNTNPAACRFYMHHGFILSEAKEHAYPDLPEEVQLIWRKRLDG